jgi:hypothetical protein
LKAEKSQKIRTLPTRPLHAVLDELFDYRNCDLIIALNKHHVSNLRSEKGSESFNQGSGMGAKRRENIEQAESTHPAHGQGKTTGDQAKAFFHEVNQPSNK